MLHRIPLLTLFFFLIVPVYAREYLVNQVLPMDADPAHISLQLYATAEGGDLLETHVLPGNQWQLQEINEETLLLL